MPVGQLVVEDMLIDKQTLQGSEIYSDLLLPFDIPNILMLWVEKIPYLYSAVVIERSYRQGKFSPDECRTFSALVPHLIRALHVRNELQRLRTHRHIYMEVVNDLPFAIIFLNQVGRIIESSPAATAMLRSGQGIAQKSGRIRAIHQDDDRRLQRAIFKTLTAHKLRTLPGDTVAVRRQGGRRSLNVALIPISSPEFLLGVTPACMLVIFDPESSPQPAIALVRNALGITDAEALLACLLFTGITLREAAERLQVSINTCKSQLKSIYARTGCRSHVDLAKALLTTGIASRLGNSPP